MSRVITSTTYLSAQDDLGLSGTYPFTVFFYVKTTSIATATQVIYRFYPIGDGTPTSYVSCNMLDGYITPRVQQEQFRSVYSEVQSTEDVWEPVCIIYDDGGAGDSLTLDTEDGTYTEPSGNTLSTFSSPDIYVGNYVGADFGLVGNIAHFTVWDSALSSGNVTSLINGADPATVDSPTRYWAFTDSSVTDSIASAVLTNSGTTNNDGDNPDFSLPILGQTAQIDVTITVDGDFPGVAPLAFTQTGDINVALGVNGTQSATKPILTNYTAQFGNTIRVIPAATTDVNNGTMYMVITEEGDVPSVTQIKAGQNSEGNNALTSESIAISRIGEHIFTEVNSLLGNTEYEVYFVHTDSNTNSDAYTSGFTTLGYGGGAAPVVFLNQNKKKQIKRKVKKEVERIQKKPFVKSVIKKASQESINRIVKAQLKTEDTDNSQIRSLRQEIRSYAKEAFELEIDNKAKITKNNMKRKLLILMAI